jgi:CDGSH-type Zn-finger protein
MSAEQTRKIVVTPNGPYIVSGGVPISVQVIGTNEAGGSWEWEQGATLEANATYALCRCGQSGNAPFCDGTHTRVGFDGTETASRASFEAQKTVQDGATMTLEDARPFCAVARFCDNFGTAWELIAQTSDLSARDLLIHEVTRCPSGRLVVRDKATGQAIEPILEPSVGIVEDPAENCSGPLWVRGGIAIQSQNGESYEVRNRMTLCRCGQSKNKPFCDGTHVEVGYKDGRA